MAGALQAINPEEEKKERAAQNTKKNHPMSWRDLFREIRLDLTGGLSHEECGNEGEGGKKLRDSYSTGACWRPTTCLLSGLGAGDGCEGGGVAK
jgi:hypothetical protein